MFCAAACGDDGGPSGDEDAGPGRDAGRPRDTGTSPEDDAGPDVDAGGGETDAGMLPPLRDDALLPDWRWDEKAVHAIDSETLGAAFASMGYGPPAGTEIYAVRIVPGVGGPAYVLYEAGGGAFSQDFWPASTVKVLSSLGALEFVGTMGFTGAANVTWDSGFGDTLSAIYDRAIRVSSNIDYDRTIRCAGFDRFNETFLSPENGFPTTVIQRSYARVDVRNVPGMTITEGGRSAYVPARMGVGDFGCPTDGNCANLFELGEAIRRVMLEAEIPAEERFALAPSDVTGLHDALCNATPSFFAAGVPSATRICHKPGWVPYNDCLDHGLIETDTGERFLLAAAAPETEGRTDCVMLAPIAEHVIAALAGRPAAEGMTLQRDAGVPIVAQLDDGGTNAEGRRAYHFTVDAPGADRIEIFTDGYELGEATGGPRFELDYAYFGGGERLVTIRAWSGATQVGYRSFRAMITPP